MSRFFPPWRIWLLAALWLLAAPAAAETSKTEAPQPAHLDFDDDTIQGDLQRPDGEMVEARKKVQHSNLIRVRSSFRDEVLESVTDL